MRQLTRSVLLVLTVTDFVCGHGARSILGNPIFKIEFTQIFCDQNEKALVIISQNSLYGLCICSQKIYEA